MALGNLLSLLVAGATPFNANWLVPVLILAFVAVNFNSNPKYAELRIILAASLRYPMQVLPEILGFAAVGLAVLGGLRWRSSGIEDAEAESKMTENELASNAYLRWLLETWPVLGHPDSLMAMQQAFVALCASLFLVRRAVDHRSSTLCLAFALLSVASGFRTGLWADTQEDWALDGPLGADFAAFCAATATIMLLLVTGRMAMSRHAAGFSTLKLGPALVLVLFLCAWLAHENHLNAASIPHKDLMVAFIDALDLCAAPLLVAGVCGVAQEASHLSGALAALFVAQALSAWWYLFFIGILDEPASEDPRMTVQIDMRRWMASDVHGHPFVLSSVSQAARMMAAILAFFGYHVLRFFSGLPPQHSEVELVQRRPESGTGKWLLGQEDLSFRV